MGQKINTSNPYFVWIVIKKCSILQLKFAILEGIPARQAVTCKKKESLYNPVPNPSPGFPWVKIIISVLSRLWRNIIRFISHQWYPNPQVLFVISLWAVMFPRLGLKKLVLSRRRKNSIKWWLPLSSRGKDGFHKIECDIMNE